MKYHTQGLILPLLLLGQACSTSPTMPASNDATAAGSVAIGSYEAQSLNGAPLPVLLPTIRGCGLTGLSGALTLRADGRFSSTFSYRQQCRDFDEVVDRALSGRYTVNGSNVVLAADSGFSRFTTAPLVMGVISGSTLSLRSTPAPGTTVTMSLRRR